MSVCVCVCVSIPLPQSEGELDVPETEEGCLQVNLVYQQVLIDSLSQLEHLLNQNRRAQVPFGLSFTYHAKCSKSLYLMSNVCYCIHANEAP